MNWADNWVEQRSDGWWFYSESYDEYGPYDSREIAVAALQEYCRICLEGKPA